MMQTDHTLDSVNLTVMLSACNEAASLRDPWTRPPA
jgi:hypothetical protein